jgi:hypothetical protein
LIHGVFERALGVVIQVEVRDCVFIAVRNSISDGIEDCATFDDEGKRKNWKEEDSVYDPTAAHYLP